MSISTIIATLNEGPILITDLLKDKYKFNETALKLAEKSVRQHFEKLKDDLYILVEYPYVDKVYRDSYYHYFSTKLNSYYRDCIRLSFFDMKINFEDFRISDGKKKLEKKFVGFMVLRPAEPHIIGRNVISPKALKNDNFESSMTNIHSTSNGIKLSVTGFPHSSQDEETISCAETTIWSLMEYFSSKYPEYRPVLPSKIISTLNNVTIERQLPSNGLNVQQISYALREFGFGTRIYSRSEYGNDFDRLISCYIGSGIPLIMAMDNKPTGNIGHAVICIGQNKVSEDLIENLEPAYLSNTKLQNAKLRQGISYYDWDDIKRKFIFMDDNFPPYQDAFLDNPVEHYMNPFWENCKINHFIAPLYPKIYLEAYVAKAYVNNFLISGPSPLLNNSEVLIKLFLTSGRSYKDCLALEDTFQEDIRDVIIETPMPKFIWIAELSNKENFKKGLAEGLIILDATEANTYNNKPLIFAAYQGTILTQDKNNNKIQKKVLPLQAFKMYTHNLRNQ